MIDIPRFIREFGPHILHVQAKDLTIDRDGLYERGVFSVGIGWQVPRLPGPGRRRLGRLVRGPVAGGLRRRLIIEHEDRDFEKTDERIKRGFLHRPRRPSAVHQVSGMTLSIDDLTERDIAKTIDHSLLRPSLTTRSSRTAAGWRRVRRRVGLRAGRSTSRRARAILAARDVAVGTVDRLPARQRHDRDEGRRGRRALADGATELDMVIQIGALKSGRDADVQADIAAVVDVAHAAGAIVKVIFENAYLTDDEKVRACRLTEAAGADFVKTSTGFAPGGATHDDLRLMRANTSPHIQVKAAGGVRTLDALLEVMALGTTRIGATATKAIIDDFRARKAGGGAGRGGRGGGRRARRAATDGRDVGRHRDARLRVHRRVPRATACATSPDARVVANWGAGTERREAFARALRQPAARLDRRRLRRSRGRPRRRLAARTTSTSRPSARRPRHGKGVACTKPLGRNGDEAAEMLRLVDATPASSTPISRTSSSTPR